MCCHVSFCIFFSVGVGAFVIRLSQIPSFFPHSDTSKFHPRVQDLPYQPLVQSRRRLPTLNTRMTVLPPSQTIIPKTGLNINRGK